MHGGWGGETVRESEWLLGRQSRSRPTLLCPPLTRSRTLSLSQLHAAIRSLPPPPLPPPPSQALVADEIRAAARLGAARRRARPGVSGA